MPWSYDGSAHPVRVRDPVASQARPGEGPSRTTWGPRPVASLWHEDLWRHLAPVRCRKAASRSLSSIGVNATELQVYPARHASLSYSAASSAHLQRQTSGDATRASRRSLRRNWRRNWRRNSVHKCPKTGPRGYFRQSVYTPASPRLSTMAQQCTQMTRNGVERPFSPICVHSCSPTHACSRDRAGPRVPRHRRPHGLHDARALGPEAHAAGAVTQPATHTSS